MAAKKRSKTANAIPLDGPWAFRLYENGRRRKAPPSSFPDEMKVPAAWQSESAGLEDGGDGWYRREVEVPAAWADGRVHLVVGGAYPRLVAYVGRKKVGDHVCPFAPFVADVTDCVRPGRKAEITLGVIEDAEARRLVWIERAVYHLESRNWAQSA